MKPAIDVIYRDIESSNALNHIINKKLEKLCRFNDGILHSKVTIDSPHKNKSKGKLFRASIELGLKGQPVTVSQDDVSIHVALRDAFNHAERKLKAVAGKKRTQRQSAEPELLEGTENLEIH